MKGMKSAASGLSLEGRGGVELALVCGSARDTSPCLGEDVGDGTTEDGDIEEGTGEDIAAGDRDETVVKLPEGEFEGRTPDILTVLFEGCGAKTGVCCCGVWN